MKNFLPQKLLAVTALALMSGAALAADLPHYKAPPPPPPPPPPLWTGFYVGLNAGGTWSNSNNTTVQSATIFNNAAVLSPLGLTYGPAAALGSSGVVSSQNSGFIGGGQIGYNWQFYNSFVAGIEADIQGIAGSNKAGNYATIVDRGLPAAGTNFVGTFATTSRSLDYLGTVRGRLGWLFTPTLLVYGTGGLAYGGVNSSVSFIGLQIPNTGSSPFSGAGAFSDTRVGWTAGGGVEWMFWPNWSAKVEYLYYDLGTVAYANSASVATLIATGDTTFVNISQTRTRFNGNVVRAGVNYHFNWGAPPVVAKY
ncbi:MAG: outer membrane beta-barrel protein [Methylocystis sp.]|uniref:outer membrane protein n=1 Tax=Methylocystis sp. TaxID=1911079 RepID=UPI00393FB1F1